MHYILKNILYSVSKKNYIQGRKTMFSIKKKIITCTLAVAMVMGAQAVPVNAITITTDVAIYGTEFLWITEHF